MRRVMIVLIASVALSACYHATIDMGPAPAAGMVAQQGSAGRVVDIPWAHGFLFGLVSPSTVEVKERCPNGVAQVQTELSFLNMFAGWLTSYLYTPMHIKVTCR